jgi:hypothetical protein
VLKRLYLSTHTFGTFVRDQMAEDVWISLWVLYSILLVYVSAFVTILGVYFETKYCDTSSIALFAQDYFGYLEYFVLPYQSILGLHFLVP